MDGSVKPPHAAQRRGDAMRRPISSAILAHAATVLATLTAASPALALESKPSPAVVSLAPSNTELLLDAGAGKAIVGVCSNCCQVLPSAQEHLKGKPTTGTFVSVNLERLTRLKPDVVLLVSGQEGIFSLLNKRGFKVVLLKNDKLTDIPSNLRQIGKLSGTEPATEQLSVKFDQALKELSATLRGASSRPRVFYCTWAQPLLTIGKKSFLNDVITTCGGTNIAGNLSQPYPHFSAEHLIMADPDVIVLPYDARDQAIFKRFPWNKLRAVRESRLYYSPAPKDDRLSRPSIGVLEGLYWLSIKIHPELKGKLDSWRRNFKN
ncbi:MAG: ABC transporter substrate-binding protein [Candidatus Melainabacteria bacterium]|nr:ABC transporter substrate-binding protein [Candidatus Melainabacteria bacterium]